MHSKKIKDLKIPFPITDKSLRIDYSKMFCFKRLDLNKLMNYEHKKARPDIAMSDIESNGKDKMLFTMIKSYIDAVDCDSFMEGLEILKDKDHGVKGHNRFLVPMDKETALINEVTDRQGILDEGYRPDMN